LSAKPHGAQIAGWAGSGDVATGPHPVDITGHFDAIDFADVLLLGRERRHPITEPERQKSFINLGGFIGRKSDGEPGAMTMWRGFQVLYSITDRYKIINPSPAANYVKDG
jgi:hypothetical protein